MIIKMTIRKADPKKEPENSHVVLLDIDGAKSELQGNSAEDAVNNAMNTFMANKKAYIVAFRKELKELKENGEPV